MSHSCRSCGEPLEETLCDLGSSPLANSYLEPEDLERPEPFYPLCVYVCTSCWLVQLPEAESAEAIFSDYAYFSSYSSSWLDHARCYTEAMIERFGLNAESSVIEVASNDGYLLQYFKDQGVPVLGIEPAENVAAVAREKGIETISRFFGAALGSELRDTGRSADLMVSNNVLAHVPNLNDFIAGFRQVLHPEGVWTIEAPHLLRLLEEVQFDTIYHEHYSYFSLRSAERAFARHGLRVFDVEQLPTHGGSLRLFVCHQGASHSESALVEALRQEEAAQGLEDINTYRAFGEKVKHTKRTLLRFLLEAAERGESVAGYGAPAKGNTLLNYCGIRPDLLEYTVDLSPHKQGRYLPGTRIPIFAPEKINQTQPRWVLILPWNLEAEIRKQMSHIKDWGGEFVIPIPETRKLGTE